MSLDRRLSRAACLCACAGNSNTAPPRATAKPPPAPRRPARATSTWPSRPEHQGQKVSNNLLTSLASKGQSFNFSWELGRNGLSRNGSRGRRRTNQDLLRRGDVADRERPEQDDETTLAGF